MGKNPARRRKRVIPLHVIPEPERGTRSVMVRAPGDDTVFFRSTDLGVEMVCGKCKAPLIVGMDVSRVRRMVFQCARCQSYNETPIT